MTTKQVDNEQMPIGALLKAARRKGILLKQRGKLRYALMPLDDDVLDFLLEHSPKLIRECEHRRKEARAGKVKSLEEVKRMFGI